MLKNNNLKLINKKMNTIVNFNSIFDINNNFFWFTIVTNTIAKFVNYFMELNIKDYKKFKVNDLFGRYITNDSIFNILTTYSPKISGYSVQKRPIYSFSYGSGKTKILIWSQMHGNESTSTKALFDCISYITNIDPSLLDSISLTVLPILNPDGAFEYTRENYNKIDLNRDAVDLTQPESKLLRSIYDTLKPHFCFNLHDQRTIYSLNNFDSSILSFLSPSSDINKLETESRIKSMSVISHVYESMSKIIPGNIGRYNDDFNINCVGDTFQSLKTPTILFESGHYNDDYNREVSRKYVCFSLIYSIQCIANKLFTDHNNYYNIPENKTQLTDIKIVNIKVKQKSTFKLTNLTIMFKEILNKETQTVEFKPEINEIGTLLNTSGHLVLDFKIIDTVFDLTKPNSIDNIILNVNKLRNIH
jgi:hypothetical protein